MACEAQRAPFDQNDKMYFCCCGALHIKKGARIVAVLVNVFMVINIIFSFTRNSTVAFYSIMSIAFSVVIFGALLYGVWKEKRLYVLPYLIFQAISVGLTILLLLVFIISIAVGSFMVKDLAEDLGNVNPQGMTKEQIDAAIAAFTVCFIIVVCSFGFLQAFFLEVIYSFYLFLRDRESSFSFNFEENSSTIDVISNTSDMTVYQQTEMTH